jgi:hypothetical protein
MNKLSIIMVLCVFLIIAGACGKHKADKPSDVIALNKPITDYDTYKIIDGPCVFEGNYVYLYHKNFASPDNIQQVELEPIFKDIEKIAREKKLNNVGILITHKENLRLNSYCFLEEDEEQLAYDCTIWDNQFVCDD